MNNTLTFKLPWYYKFFIRFMKDFWKDLPEEHHGYNYSIHIDIITYWYYTSTIKGKPLGNFDSIQDAYVKIRWKTMWKQFRNCLNDTGIKWRIKNNSI